MQVLGETKAGVVGSMNGGMRSLKARVFLNFLERGLSI